MRYLGSRTLIITGIAGNFCVLFTANDAYMRDYGLIVPSDCTVSNTAKENREALALMRKFLKADTRPSPKLRLPRVRKKRTFASGRSCERQDEGMPAELETPVTRLGRPLPGAFFPRPCARNYRVA